jgi:hypothetical protein
MSDKVRRQVSTPVNQHERVSQVLVVFKTHLDMGFTDYAKNVVRSYVEQYIPSALHLAKETSQLPDRFVWTMGSWLVHHYLEVTSGKSRRRMEAAIAEGDICWHALPFTTHTELMDAELFRQGLRYSQQLDARFGRTTSAAKMTDVPGHTKAMVPLLAERGVRLLHIGVNPASTVPAVPPVFLWRCDGAEVVVVYEKDYGATTVLPGGMAMSVNLTGDNLGPQNLGEISKVYQQVRSSFPQATVAAGTLNTIADWIWDRRKALPVVSSEIGDTWIHGVGTDPAKTARFRALCRLRSRWIASNQLEAGGKTDFPFAENLLCTAEHTWGMDIKTHLDDWRTYSMTGLHRVLKKANFRAVAASWDEQRAYVQLALNALPPDLADEAKKELSFLRIRTRLGKWKKIPTFDTFRCGPWSINLAPDGSIQRLCREGSPRLFADVRHRLASFAHQTFSPGDYRRFYRQYNTLDVDWARKDFNKSGLPICAAARHKPSVTRLESHANGEVRTLLAFPAAAVRSGAPSLGALTFSSHAEGLDLRLEWQGKKANRMPEALWMGFRPWIASDPAWTVEKFGIPIDPLDVVHDGNRHLHAADGIVSANDFSIYSCDAPLVAPGRPRLLNFSDQLPDLSQGVTFNLYNNVWGTNFPMWYSDDAVFRFELRWRNAT